MNGGGGAGGENSTPNIKGHSNQNDSNTRLAEADAQMPGDRTRGENLSKTDQK